MNAPSMPATRARPTYVGIGAQKCASTWLHRVLAEHPEVAVPEIKEVDFFSYRYDHGLQWYERGLARGRRQARVRGEISPSYFADPAVPGRIARYAPGVRILLSLRDPVERALSNHRHEVRVGHLQEDFSFEAGLANNPMYVEQGLYATHLRRWLRHFGRDRILVVLMDDIARDPLAVCRTVYGFLGVDVRYAPALMSERFNPSYASRSTALATVKDAVYSATRLPGLRRVWNGAARTGLRSLYRRINRVPSAVVIPPARPETLAQLRRRFEPEIRELEDLIDRSLEGWLAPYETREAVA